MTTASWRPSSPVARWARWPAPAWRPVGRPDPARGRGRRSSSTSSARSCWATSPPACSSDCRCPAIAGRCWAPGLCGGLTTFSTMQVETVRMIEHHHYGLAVGYTVASIAAGLLAVYVATALVRRVQGAREPMNVAVWAGVLVIGGLGSMARFMVDRAVARRAARPFPFGTLTVNVSGAVLLGFITGLALSHQAALLAGTAFVGAYTTFSTWMLETQRLTEERQIWPPWPMWSVSVALGLRRRDARPVDGGPAVNDTYLKLTAYFAERQRAGSRFLAEAMLDLYAERAVASSVMLRGIASFGPRHVDPQRPIADAVRGPAGGDRRRRHRGARSAALVDDVVEHDDSRPDHPRTRPAATGAATSPHGGDAVKLTLYIGRRRRLDGAPAYYAVCDLLHRHGFAGAVGVPRGRRHRPRPAPPRAVLQPQRRRADHDHRRRQRGAGARGAARAGGGAARAAGQPWNGCGCANATASCWLGHRRCPPSTPTAVNCARS